MTQATRGFSSLKQNQQSKQRQSRLYRHRWPRFRHFDRIQPLCGRFSSVARPYCRPCDQGPPFPFAWLNTSFERSDLLLGRIPSDANHDQAVVFRHYREHIPPPGEMNRRPRGRVQPSPGKTCTHNTGKRADGAVRSLGLSIGPVRQSRIWLPLSVKPRIPSIFHGSGVSPNRAKPRDTKISAKGTTSTGIRPGRPRRWFHPVSTRTCRNQPQ